MKVRIKGKQLNDSAAACQKWAFALSRWFNGDKDLIRQVRRACGRALLQATSNKPLLAESSEPITWETTFWRACGSVLGTYEPAFYQAVKEDAREISRLPHNNLPSVEKLNHDEQWYDWATAGTERAILTWLTAASSEAYKATN